MPAPMFFVNLKRFDVPKALGGICTAENPERWIQDTLKEALRCSLGKNPAAPVTFFLPESLILPAAAIVREYGAGAAVTLGCQGVHWDDVATGGNFGAFTSCRSAKAMRAAGCSWALIGHSEERRALLHMLTTYDPDIAVDPAKRTKAASTVHAILRGAVQKADAAGLNILYCLGETAEEKGCGDAQAQEQATSQVLRTQVTEVFKDLRVSSQLAMGYEPIWAIGPGKTPPDQAYIRFALNTVRQHWRDMGQDAPPTVYGGGLKVENAAAVAQAGSDGGLIALTHFTDPIGFYPAECAAIITTFTAAQAK